MRAPHPELSRAPEARVSQVESDIAERPEIAGFQGYEKLVNNNASQRAEFVAAEEGNPEITYRLLVGAHLEELVSLGQAAEASLVTLIGSERERAERVQALFDALDTRKEGKPLDIEGAQKKAYLQCNRMFRATPFDIPGLTMNKDLSYARGDNVVNPIIDLIETQEDMNLMFAGKTDPTLEDHLPICESIAPGSVAMAAKIRARYGLAA